MSLPLQLAGEIKKGNRRSCDLSTLQHHECKDDLIYIKNYRTFEYYKRINDRFVFARKLLPREIEDFYFNNGKSFSGCSIVERMK